MHIIVPALHRIDELADDQQGGIAGVVVDIFQALVHNPSVVGGEHLHLVALVLENPGNEIEVDWKHGGKEDGILFLHLLSKEETPGLIIN